MVLENPLLPYLTWLLGYPWTEPRAFLDSALFRFVLTAAVLSVIALVLGFMIALVRHGPLKAGDITYRVVVNGLMRVRPGQKVTAEDQQAPPQAAAPQAKTN